MGQWQANKSERTKAGSSFCENFVKIKTKRE